MTGGSGLIGREVVKKLADMGCRVISASLDSIKPEGAQNHVTADLTDFSVCSELTREVDAVFHLAGIKGSLDVTERYPATFMVPMLRFNTSLLEAARLNSVEHLVFTSSIGAYSPAEIFREDEGFSAEPMDTYPGWAKRIAEIQIQAYNREHGLNWAVVRPCNVYGPGDNFDPNNAMVIPSLLMRILQGENPLKVWGDGSAIRDFAYSGDVADGIIAASFAGTKGSFVNLGSGVGHSVRELVETMAEFIDFEYEFDATKPSGFPKRVMDISRAQDWLGFEPKISLREGLELTWNWLRENPTEHLKKKNYFAGDETEEQK